MSSGVTITLPDGSERVLGDNATGADLAAALGGRAAKDALIAIADGVELDRPAAPAVIDALADDLNTPKALAELFALAKRAVTPEGKGALLAAGRLMGLLEQNPEAWFAAQTVDADIDAAAVEALIAERAQARADRDSAAADAARDKGTRALWSGVDK